MPMYSCTDVNVQDVYLVLRVLEPVVGTDVIMPLGLLNKRIKNINMTLKHYEQEAYIYQHDLKQQIEQNWWEECKIEINKVRELRHNTVQERQTKKFIKLMEEKRKRNNERDMFTLVATQATMTTPRQLSLQNPIIPTNGLLTYLVLL